MFSNENVRDLHQHFPSHTGDLGTLPSLILASSGQGFITLSHLQSEFQKLVTEATKRIPLADLAHTLDTTTSILTQLTLLHPHLTLLSAQNAQAISKSERNEIAARIQDTLSDGLLSKREFATQNQIDTQSLDALLRLQAEKLVVQGEHVCTAAYETKLSNAILEELKRLVSEVSTTTFLPANLPGHPPQWLITHHLENLITSHNLSEKVVLCGETGTGVLVQSAGVKDSTTKALASDLLPGTVSHLDLSRVFEQKKDVYDSLEDVQRAFKEMSGIVVLVSYAVSESWIAQFTQRSLHAAREKGTFDVATALRQEFPAALHSAVEDSCGKAITAALAKSDGSDMRYFGGFLATSVEYEKAREDILGKAKEDANVQWQRLQEHRENQIAFNLANIIPTSDDTSTRSIHGALSKEKGMEKALEESFQSGILTQEAANEAEFATFWTERVILRTHVYSEGLNEVEDAKLKDQLSELLATYVAKELVPDTITKAQTQGMLLSRRTKKNVARFESTLQTAKTDLTTVMSTIDKFAKKQTIREASTADLEQYKGTMISDMLRRMQKQQKPSGGPVLFLTLVIILFAKHYAGAVYATGKFAPKLLKQLKSKLHADQYKQLEKWKEAAKGGTLSAEDRENMKTMAET